MFFNAYIKAAVDWMARAVDTYLRSEGQKFWPRSQLRAKCGETCLRKFRSDWFWKVSNSQGADLLGRKCEIN